jgi:hypothetical protein
MLRTNLYRPWPVTACVIAIATVGLAPELTGRHPVSAQGTGPRVSFPTDTSLSRITGDALGDYTNESCSQLLVTTNHFVLRISRQDCPRTRYVSVDLGQGSSGGQCLIPAACGGNPFELNTCGLNDRVYDLFIEGDSPFRNSALSNGIRLSKVTLNVERVLCDAFYLVYEENFQVVELSPNVRRVRSSGLGWAKLYHFNGKRHVLLGRWQVPMQYNVSL